MLSLPLERTSWATLSFESTNEPGHKAKKRVSPVNLRRAKIIEGKTTKPALCPIGQLTSINYYEPLQSNQLYGITVRSDTDLIRLEGTINRQKAVMLVDSGSSGNFISETYAERNKLQVQILS